MKALVFAFVLTVVPLTAEARDSVTYAVDGETFEGYRTEAKGASKGLILIIHDWDGLTEYEMKRSEMLADMGLRSRRRLGLTSAMHAGERTSRIRTPCLYLRQGARKGCIVIVHRNLERIDKQNVRLS